MTDKMATLTSSCSCNNVFGGRRGMMRTHKKAFNLEINLWRGSLASAIHRANGMETLGVRMVDTDNNFPFFIIARIIFYLLLHAPCWLLCAHFPRNLILSARNSSVCKRGEFFIRPLSMNEDRNCYENLLDSFA